MTTWTTIEGTGYPDQTSDIAWPFYAQVGPEGTAGSWSWTLLRANRDGTEEELTSGTADSEDLAKMLAETAGLGALAQFETAEQENAS